MRAYGSGEPGKRLRANFRNNRRVGEGAKLVAEIGSVLSGQGANRRITCVKRVLVSREQDRQRNVAECVDFSEFKVVVATLRRIRSPSQRDISGVVRIEIDRSLAVAWIGDAGYRRVVS